MPRRPSVASVNAVASSSSSRLEPSASDSSQYASGATFKPLNGPSWPPRSASLSANTGAKSHNPNAGTDLDPEELFTKYPISEVRSIQQRLRADAEDKQEELRLMVGERYRDLLQASTSIISIARSSKRVMEALEETKDAIVSQEQSSEPRRSYLAGKDDAQLQTLQLLSAHMKLLLDAPEHLWRLIERKSYFEAAWLFLLARVVHRALVRDDEQDEESWSSRGIDVLEQFPLIQRQWEAVSQFRSQVIHKATASLREYNSSAENTCAILLTLHLLDSKPLMETFSTLLVQRTKTLQTLLSKSLPTSEAIPSISIGNGHPLGKVTQTDTTRSRKIRVREVRQATQAVLEAISNTLRTARLIFQRGAGVRRSLIEHALEYMQAESANSGESPEALPAELALSTQALLASLPSSTYFLMLPAAIRTYKPYVDLSSSSSSVAQGPVASRIQEWTHKATTELRASVDRWLTCIQGAKEVWRIRSWTRKWLHSAPGLDGAEKLQFTSVLDDAFQRRVVDIWKLALTNAQNTFKEHLLSKASSFTSAPSSAPDSSPIEFLFDCPALPALSHTGGGSLLDDTSLQRYKSVLRHRINGRTPFLDDVLSGLEGCAQALQEDFSPEVIGSDEDAQALARQLTESFQPDAESLCTGVIDALTAASEVHSRDPTSSMSSLVFIGQAADELSTSSPFISNIGCSEDAVQSFRHRTREVHDQILESWLKQTVGQVNHEYSRALQSSRQSSSPEPPSDPSAPLTQSLFSLSSAIQQLIPTSGHPRREGIVKDALGRFLGHLLDALDTDNPLIRGDLLFLRKILSFWGPQWSKLVARIDQKIAQKVVSNGNHGEYSEPSASIEHIARVQTLLATLLPPFPSTPVATPSVGKEDKFAALLPYSVPRVDQQQTHPVMELAKPSARFGLLLVGGSTAPR
ncbi:hypothetical protein PLICRDRAFT_415757 [Plicaturopsis crispa FD-325 SS-3]|nr:hypothetical protein PLICRDRAFT_415757 [Plicaturopsis crispa FD-325 SS-3]